MASKLKVLAFAQARTKLGFSETEIEAQPDQTPREALSHWSEQLAQLPPCRIAIDEQFHDWDTPIGEGKVLAILPPVSGG